MESSQHHAGQPEGAGLLLLKTSVPLEVIVRLRRAAGTRDGEGCEWASAVSQLGEGREWASAVSQPVKLTFPHLGIAVISAEVIVT